MSETGWITIGGHADGSKKHVGGTHVKIENGKIQGGPPGLVGESLNHIVDHHKQRLKASAAKPVPAQQPHQQIDDDSAAELSYRFSQVLSGGEKSALTKYGGDYYVKVNKALRGASDGDDELKTNLNNSLVNKSDLIKHLDESFRKAPELQHSTTLFRTFNNNAVHSFLASDNPVGSIFNDKGFVSTSRSSESVPQVNQPHPVFLRIHARKGSKVVPMENFADYDEKEILLNRGSRFKVTGVKRQGNQMIADVELLND